MSMNEGIFARISPLSERITATVTRAKGGGRGAEGGELDPRETESQELEV